MIILIYVVHQDIRKNLHTIKRISNSIAQKNLHSFQISYQEMRVIFMWHLNYACKLNSKEFVFSVKPARI